MLQSSRLPVHNELNVAIVLYLQQQAVNQLGGIRYEVVKVLIDCVDGKDGVLADIGVAMFLKAEFEESSRPRISPLCKGYPVGLTNTWRPLIGAQKRAKFKSPPFQHIPNRHGQMATGARATRTHEACRGNEGWSL